MATTRRLERVAAPVPLVGPTNVGGVVEVPTGQKYTIRQVTVVARATVGSGVCRLYLTTGTTLRDIALVQTSATGSSVLNLNLVMYAGDLFGIDVPALVTAHIVVNAIVLIPG